jgi:hypothetical protein
MTRWLLGSSLALVLTAITVADDKGTVVEIDGLKSTAPAAWAKQKVPEGPMFKSRVAQFKVGKATGDAEDAEVMVSYFGKGQGGSLDQNLKRWKDQFKAPAGEKAKVEKFKVGGADVTVLDVSGTYLSKFPPFDPNAKVTEKPDYRAVQVFFASPNGPYFIRLLGPAKTVEGQKKAFDEWVKNFK